MPVHKRKYRDGRVVWRYKFEAPGSTRDNRTIIAKVGFATKKEAQDAESVARAEVQRKYAMEKAGGSVTAAVPTTLGGSFRSSWRSTLRRNWRPRRSSDTASR